MSQLFSGKDSGRHESSHIVKAHADLALWEFLGSHRFNEIQQDDYLWEFVLIRVRKSSQQNICVIRGICGFKAKPQISTNYLWAKWPVSQ